MTIFEKIAQGALPASMVYRDDKAMAFMDIHPVSPGHTLICPLNGVSRLDQLDDDVRAHLWELARKVAKAQREALGSQAQHFLVNDGAEANQTVPHVHIHVIPRYKGDRITTILKMILHLVVLAIAPPVSAKIRRRLDEEATKIKAALAV